MSSTTGVQNLLVNLFRPYYTYDSNSATAVFIPKIEMSNIDIYSGNSLAVATLSIGDRFNNVYLGSNSGNPEATFQNCTNNVAYGFEAAKLIVNTNDSAFIGYNTAVATSNGSNLVVVGANTTVGTGSSNSVYVGATQRVGGSSNVIVGAATVATGSNNILIGTDISAGPTNYSFRVGKTYLYGDMSSNWLGLGVPTPSSTSTKLDVSGLAQATGGFSSLRGTITSAAAPSTTTIGTLKKGVILVSALDPSSITNYQTIQVYCTDATSGTSVVAMTNVVQSGEVSVLFPSSSNIEISNTTTVRNIAWSITYFPLP